jgi:hypothetical protein
MGWVEVGQMEDGEKQSMKYNGVEVKPVAPEIGQWRMKPPWGQTGSVLVRVEYIWEDVEGGDLVELYGEDGKFYCNCCPPIVAEWPVMTGLSLEFLRAYKATAT